MTLISFLTKEHVEGFNSKYIIVYILNIFLHLKKLFRVFDS